MSARIRVLLTAVGAVSSAGAAATEFDCMIEPRQVLEIRSPIEGLIDSVEVERGDLVAEGQILAILDTDVDRVAAEMARQRSTMEGAIAAGRSRVEFAERKSSRVVELQNDNFISEELFDQAMAEKQLAEAELQDALDNRRLAELEYQRQLEIIRKKTIVSPIDGVVTERILNPGELAEAGVGRKPLLELAEIGVLYVEVIMPAAWYQSLAIGTPAVIIPEVPAGSEFSASVSVIDRVMDSASGTFVVRLELPNPDNHLPAGIRCRAQFEIDEADLPVAAF